MIKASFYLTRRADLTFEEFSEYWLNEHIPLVTALPAFKSYVRRYTLHLRILGLPPELPVLPYDGVGDLWVDGLESLLEVVQTSDYLQIAVPDEETFIDRSKTKMLLTTEREIKI